MRYFVFQQKNAKLNYAICTNLVLLHPTATCRDNKDFPLVGVSVPSFGNAKTRNIHQYPVIVLSELRDQQDFGLPLKPMQNIRDRNRNGTACLSVHPVFRLPAH